MSNRRHISKLHPKNGSNKRRNDMTVSTSLDRKEQQHQVDSAQLLTDSMNRQSPTVFSSANIQAESGSNVSQAKSHLLGIPVEIRLQIYGHLFANVDMMDIIQSKLPITQRQHDRHSILMVNKQLRNEAAPVFFKECIFHTKHYMLHDKYHSRNPFSDRHAIQKLFIDWNPPPSSAFRATQLQLSYILNMRCLQEVVIDCKGMNYIRLVPDNTTTQLNSLEVQILSKFHKNENQFPKWLRRLMDGDRHFRLYIIMYYLPGRYDHFAQHDERPESVLLIAAKVEVDTTKLVGLRYHHMYQSVEGWQGLVNLYDAWRSKLISEKQTKWQNHPLVMQDGTYDG